MNCSVVDNSIHKRVDLSCHSQSRTDTVKTKYSKKQLPLDPALVAMLQDWRRMSEFNKDDDWVWASPYVAGEMPYYPNAIQFNYIRPAGKKAGLGDSIGWHTFRHTYRAWLDQTKAPMAVQKDLMRHASISTTMNVYGGSMPEPMREANSEVVKFGDPPITVNGVPVECRQL